MGNTTSTNNKKNNKSLSNVVDFIATNYILTTNFQDMKNLQNINYCNDLVILTSKILSEKLNTLEIDYLAQRIKEGEVVNEMANDKVIYSYKDGFKNLDENNSIKKKRLCMGISKFYIKIAHIFAAIITTINPIYKYKDANGNTQEVKLMDKAKIPNLVNISTRINLSLCKKRINVLLNNHNYDVNKDETITVNPNFCNMNYDSTTNNSKTLNTEPGIPELGALYYDKYNYDEGKFTGMTPETKKIYLKDVKKFYKIFTGKSNVPKNIERFSQIPLKDFHNSEGCIDNGIYRKKYQGDLKEKLFAEYANHIKKMMKKAKTNQDKLLKIIDKLFLSNINSQTKRKEIIINPNLTDKILQEIVVETRNIITNLYLTCEQDFLKGLEIFESIVEKQILDTSENQVKELENEIQKLKIINNEDSTEEPPKEEPPKSEFVDIEINEEIDN